jgi:hypothetical protein
MTTNYHTAISVGAAANAATINTPLGALDAALTNAQSGVYNVLAYGAKGDGTTDDTTAIQAAIDAIRAAVPDNRAYRRILYFAPGKTYNVESSIDFTNLDYVIVEGNEAVISAVGGLDGYPLWDMLGSSQCELRNLYFFGSETNPPVVLLSLGRSTAEGGESSNNVFHHCHFYGYWTKYAIYNDSAEQCEFFKCKSLCYGPVTAKGGLYYSAYDDESIPSLYTTRSATNSAACLVMDYCDVSCYGTLTNFIPYYLSVTDQVSLFNCFGATYNSYPIIKTNGNTSNLTIDTLLCEGTPDKTIWFSARSGSGTIKNVSIIGCGFGTYTTYGIYQDAGTSIRRMFVRSSSGATAGNASALAFAGAVYYSDIDQWWNSDTGTLAFADLYQSRVGLVDHTLTISGTQTLNQISRTAGQLLNKLSVGVNTDSSLGVITKVYRTTATITVGDLTAGSSYRNDFTLNGVVAGDMVLVGMNKIAEKVQVTAIAYAGGGIINITNHGASTWEAGDVTFTFSIFRVTA